MSPVEIAGWTAALVGTLLGLPQALRLARTRNAEGLSLVAWQLVLGLNLAWMVHGVTMMKWNLIVPNLLGLLTTVPILVLLSRELGRALPRVLLPGVVLAAGMVAVDLGFGTTAYGIVAMWPALLANAGQSLELVRSPRVTGVSPVFLFGAVLNQALWLAWGVLVADSGTVISAVAAVVVTGFNLVWWGLRMFGLRSFGIPTRDEVLANVRARREESRERRASIGAGE
jgi:uncharacterized protein with PQ loop repeat